MRDEATGQAPISRDTPRTDLQSSICNLMRVRRPSYIHPISNVGREKSESERIAHANIDNYMQPVDLEERKKAMSRAPTR